MYDLPYFKEPDPQKLLAFMQEFSFALITGRGDDYPVATHIPLFIEAHDNGRLRFSGHLMKKSGHHLAFEKDPHVLVVFNGPHTYVSASWYTEPAVASTWNYLAVHAQGIIRFLDEAATLEAVKKITDKYEGPDSPAAFQRLSPDYVNRLVKAIVAFEIDVTAYDHVFKLSQNHGEATRTNIATQLAQKNEDDAQRIATEIKNRI